MTRPSPCRWCRSPEDVSCTRTTTDTHDGWAVRCDYCGARGPVDNSEWEAMFRWAHTVLSPAKQVIDSIRAQQVSDGGEPSEFGTSVADAVAEGDPSCRGGGLRLHDYADDEVPVSADSAS